MVQCKVKLLLDHVLFVPVNSSSYKSKQNGGSSTAVHVEPCFVHSLTLGRRVTVVVLSFVLFTALQRAALTSSRQLWYEQAKHVDGLQFDSWILLKCFRS